ncbi:hypothetical protein [Mameliella sp.]|uniref:hypothetical protein n=1 Tax=Mameliella sp. TaxID=1924940 RepID=UPI003B512307
MRPVVHLHAAQVDPVESHVDQRAGTSTGVSRSSGSSGTTKTVSVRGGLQAVKAKAMQVNQR